MARYAPPASDGLPPSDSKPDGRETLRQRHPAARKAQLVKTEDIIGTAIAVLAGGDMTKEAAERGVSVASQPVKDLIRQARERFIQRVDRYVDAHLIAAETAALAGDAKPAQWALEHIQFEGERVVEPVDTRPQGQPAGLRIGVVIGGIPQPASQAVETSIVTAEELPPLEPSGDLKELMP